MKPRINYYEAAPDAFKAVLNLENYVANESGIEKQLLHLLKIRASQINGCAYCVDMHVKEARNDGINEQWINLISVWQESPVYDKRERALLSWTEEITKLLQNPVSEKTFNLLKEHFTDAEITRLTVAIGIINIWNRLAVGFRIPHEVD